jgi:hypothetical protein
VRPTRWERAAERENARRAASAPLLAAGGMLPVATADERELRWERIAAEAELRLRLSRERAERTGAMLRAEVAERVSPEALAALDARRAVLPRSAEYSADFWRRIAAGKAEYSWRSH